MQENDWNINHLSHLCLKMCALFYIKAHYFRSLMGVINAA